MINVDNSKIFNKVLNGVRGKLTFNKLIKPITWLRVGGEAELFFQPYDLDDLCDFLHRLPMSVSVFPIGVCSNLLVGDYGVGGVIVRLGREFSKISCQEEFITAGAGLLDSKVADYAASNGVDLSFLKTIPGTIGGAIKMNAGCYGTCIADVFECAEVVLRSGEIQTLSRTELNFSYRQSELPAEAIVTKVTLKGSKNSPENIKNIMRKNQERRVLSQPIRQKTGGSTFKNPSKGHICDGKVYKAWQLIDKASLRGKIIGGAQVSNLHSNFLINIGSATAKDFESLGSSIQKAVFSESGIKLEWEIKKIGIFKNSESDYS